MEFQPYIFFSLGPLPITNTLLNTLLIDIIILTLAFVLTRNIKIVPGFLQNGAEFIVGGLYNFTKSIAGDRTPQIFPYFITFFIFILLANWSGLIPGMTTIGLEKEHGHVIPFLRSTTTDLNTTLALALVSLAATHIMSIKTLGLKEYIGRFISLNPILLFVGALEIVSEITKIISLSFRLFGNIFAGEVVLETVSGIFSFLFPLPFLGLEFIVGAVQALVFSMLTLAFMVILTTPHHEEAKEEVSH